MSLNELESLIKNETEKTDGEFAVVYFNFRDNEELLINEKEEFHAASTMKVPVMIEVFKQSAQNKFSLQDSILIRNEFKSIVDGSLYKLDINEDSGEELYSYIGKTRTIYELVHAMITVSSNLATNILIDLVSPDSVMFTMKALGAGDIKVLRGVEDMKAYNNGLNNTTTAYDLALIFKAMYSNQIVNESVCNEMLKILLEQKHKDNIPAKLPGNVRVAHKTGWITGVRHDAAIVYAGDENDYILVLLSKNIIDDSKGKEIIQNISRYVYDYAAN